MIKNMPYYDDTSTLQSKIHCVELQRACKKREMKDERAVSMVVVVIVGYGGNSGGVCVNDASLQV